MVYNGGISMFENFSFTSYFIDKNIWEYLKNEIIPYNNILIIVGEKSFDSIKDKILPMLSDKEYSLEKYHGECSYENVEEILNNTLNKKFDLALGIGGGKAIDTAKIAAFKLGIEIFSIPTIASTCSAASALSVVYNNDGSFKEFFNFPAPPKKTFIDLETIKSAPAKYIWAGMGDTLAKFYEVRMKYEYVSEKNNGTISYPNSLGKEISHLCGSVILENGVSAYFSKDINEEFKKVVLSIVVNTGMVSNLVDEFLNGAIAHSVFYGLTLLPSLEKEHLHGEVVAFGILVQLILEGKKEEYIQLLPFYKKLAFPTKLSEVVKKEEFEEMEDKILWAILAGPDIIDMEFNINKENLKETLFAL